MEACDGKDFVYACKFFAQKAFIKGVVQEDGLKSIFQMKKANVVVVEMFIAIFKRQSHSIFQIRRMHMPAHSEPLSSFVTYRMPLINLTLKRMKPLSIRKDVNMHGCVVESKIGWRLKP